MPSVAATVLVLAAEAWAGGRVVVPPISVPLVSAAPVAAAVLPANFGGAPALASLNLAQLTLPLPGLVLRPAPALSPAIGSPAASARPLAALAHAGEHGGRIFDGERRPKAVQLELPLPGLARASTVAPPAEGLPRYLSVADPEHAKWLGEVVRTAWASRSARRVFVEAERLSHQRGRPITVFVTDLRANNGEYVYDWDMVRIGQHYLKRDPVEAAATVVHELLHVVQKAQLLPTDALEMELEAYMLTFEVMRELGIPFDKGSFYKQARRKFRGPLPEFIQWLGKEYDGNISLLQSRMSKYVAELEKRRDKARKRLARWDRKIKAAQKVAEEMWRTKQDAGAIATYRDDVLTKLEMDRRQDQYTLQWLERDLGMLATPEGRERYRAYARRVMDYTRRVHARYNAADAARP